MAGIINIASYWGDEAIADVKLLVFESGADTSSEGVRPQLELPLHSLAVSALSEWFQARLHGIWTDAAADTPSRSSKRQRTEAQQRPIHDHFLPGEPVTVPEAVLKHAYTNEPLPEDATTLVWMAKRADYWGMPGSYVALLTHLTDLAAAGQVRLSDLHLVDLLPEGRKDKVSVGDKEQVVDLRSGFTSKVLTQHVANTCDAWTDLQKREQLISLPFPLFAAWLEWVACGKVPTDHENTIALLITAWYDRQDPAPSEEQCARLRQLITSSKLSPSFHLQVMHHLKWWAAERVGDSGVTRVLRALNGSGQAWQGRLRQTKQRADAKPVPAMASWALGPTELKAMLREDWRSASKDLYFAGYNIELVLQREAQYVLKMGAAWPPELLAHGLAGKVTDRPAAGFTVLCTDGDECFTPENCILPCEKGQAVCAPLLTAHFATYQDLSRALGSDRPEITVTLSEPL